MFVLIMVVKFVYAVLLADDCQRQVFVMSLGRKCGSLDCQLQAGVWI